MQGAASDWVRAAGPVIVVAKISTEPAPLVLPPRDGGYLKNRFRQAWESIAGQLLPATAVRKTMLPLHERVVIGG
jgi:hypothetical protein